MTVTALVPAGRRSRRVYIDGEERFLLSDRFLREQGIEEGTAITGEMLAEIMEHLRLCALERCGTLLSARDLTAYELRAKLMRAGFPEDTADTAVRSMLEAHYIDDRRLAASYVQNHLEDRSISRIRRDLSAKGVDRELIAEAIGNAASPAEAARLQEGQIRSLLRKRGFDPETADRQERMKTMAFLYRRGFPQDMIRRMAGGGEDIDG